MSTGTELATALGEVAGQLIDLFGGPAVFKRQTAGSGYDEVEDTWAVPPGPETMQVTAVAATAETLRYVPNTLYHQAEVVLVYRLGTSPTFVPETGQWVTWNNRVYTILSDDLVAPEGATQVVRMVALKA